MKIATGLKIFGAAVTTLAVVFLIVGYAMLSHMTAASEEMYRRGLIGSKLLADSNNAVWELRFGIANYTLASPENRKKILDGRPALYESLGESLRNFAASGRLTDQDVALKDLQDAFEKYKVGAPKWFELIDADKQTEAAEYRSKVTNAAGSAMVKNIKILIEKQIKVNETLQKDSQAVAENARKLLLAIAAGTIIMIMFTVVFLVRTIARPLQQIQSEIEGIESSGDFTRRISVKGRHELGAVADSFNMLMNTIQDSLRQIMESVVQVSQAAKRLSTSADQVASGSERQSSATSSIATTIEQLTVSINMVSDNARDAQRISAAAGEVSNGGQEVIQKTASEVTHIAGAMREAADIVRQLGQQSNHISSVVQVIKEVADQTNLLALNAAIEAARAGEQGRGFAVVADEVRKLAERTTQSTGQITQMISGIQQSAGLAVTSMGAAVQQMDGGVSLAQQAGRAIDQIKTQAHQVTETINSIALALAEQSSASHNIATQVESVATLTEANSSATRETAVAIRDLERLSQEMFDVANKFRV